MLLGFNGLIPFLVHALLLVLLLLIIAKPSLSSTVQLFLAWYCLICVLFPIVFELSDYLAKNCDWACR